ncbi:magnesium transporter [Amphibacillus marinus]|uniref:Magnesium transporter MgtE n=1 Tax=Amphibacillus marinus TaxID=872970 RepID=A0A1H8Q3Y4_9BACI|nr:magnesium transporter [Amphibacillus marinus]SEO48681.1 magnesium transporter [Amphibacillus marinus]
MVKFEQFIREHYATEVLNHLKNRDKEQFRELFLDLHRTNQMDIFIQLNQQLRSQLYSMVSGNEFADVFEGLDLAKQKQVIQELDERYIAAIFNTISTDEIADFLAELDPSEANKILNTIDNKRAIVIRELLSYPIETAGGIMAKEFVAVKATDKVSEVIDNLRFSAPNAETIYYLYVLDTEACLVGVLSLRDLIIAPAFETIEHIMSTDVISVTTEMDQEDVAKIMQKYDFLAMPVVTKKNVLTGIITIDDVMDIMEDEMSEDFDEFIGAKGGTDLNISSFEAAKKRAPWIVLLAFTGLLTGGIIDFFEAALEEVVLLAVFIPLIMDSAGNAGTQSLAVIVRAMATGSSEKKSIWQTIKREFGTGLILGVIVAIVLLILVPIVYGSFILALIVAASLFITLSFSTIFGGLVPIVINKLKLDPAIASGPFITTVNDVLGLFVYFTIASTFISYL